MRNMSAVAPFTSEINKEPALLDSRGEAVEVRKGLMVALDKQASKRIEISQATAWILPLLVALGMLLFNYVGGLVGWTGRVGVVEVKVDQTQKDIEAMRIEMGQLRTILLEQRVKDAEKKGELRGFTLGQEK